MLASSASTLALIGSLVAFLEGAFWDMLSFSHVKRRRTPHHHRDGSSLPSKIHKARLPLCRSPGPGRLRRRKLTLVLDLDETLVHTATNPTDPVLMHGGIHYPFDLRVDIRRDTAQHKSVFVWKRPYLDLFMSEVSKYCEVVIYTAGLKRYASPIIDLLDLNGVVKKRLYRDACGPRLDPLGSYTKDLRLASGTAFPERALIIDNSPSAYKMTCPDNAVPIKSFFGNNPDDDELLCLLPFLSALCEVQDVRSILSLRDAQPSPFVRASTYTSIMRVKIKTRGGWDKGLWMAVHS
eukprot:CAMPEP_0185748672 /NCGR_PEP_ID=MMETSP1174-20130828/7391_1 /TAXON_ID=35687 /ORGANISM="Dictyocha speculum, Strain CCMP1381" /LENGTH=293 /DNA_ID=CAMNT_0028424473 /DNA_START=246 /DNA_END=1128 /DNA_ORIENTATION=+